MPFALDPPTSSSFLSSLHYQAYPLKPQGLALSDSLFKATLHPLTPLAVSVLYLIATRLANNRLRNGKTPKDLIKGNQTAERGVLAHNLLLCLYSAWTAVEVFRILVGYFGNGIRQGGLKGLTNAFCTVPVHDPTVGLSRLAYLFYLSKFYEVVDSVILALKGKKVSNLQSYHHAGAMWSMWAGLRYSASPIWIFCQFNSFIHALMYCWYSLSTLKIPAGALKRSMTTAQITQLVVGFFVATSYLYIRYDPTAYPSGSVPSAGVESSYYSNVQNSLLQGTNSSNFSNSSSTGSKKMNGLTSLPGYQEARQAVLNSVDSNGSTTCLASSGAVFAVALNAIYLGPLIALFVRFYIRSYNKKSSLKKE